METTIPSSGKPRKDYPVSIPVPTDSEFMPKNTKIKEGTKLQACWARKWNPITAISENGDGTINVHWDDFGSASDCSMLREELIIKKRDLQSLMNAPSTEARIWTDATGKFKVKAELFEQTSTHVTLLTEKGKRVTLPIGKLSQEDQDFLAGITSKSANPFE